MCFFNIFELNFRKNRFNYKNKIYEEDPLIDSNSINFAIIVCF